MRKTGAGGEMIPTRIHGKRWRQEKVCRQDTARSASRSLEAMRWSLLPVIETGRARRKVLFLFSCTLSEDSHVSSTVLVVYTYPVAKMSVDEHL